MQAGLSYEQGPPFGVPLRLFLAAPLFLFLAAVLALATPQAWLASRWTPAALAITHLLTLGYLGTVMSGALLQMLPVIVGSPVPAARLVGGFALWGLSAGAALLATAFLVENHATLFSLAAALLAAGLTPFLGGVALSLLRTRALPAVVWPMRLAWLALSLTCALGVALGTGLAGLWTLTDAPGLTALHAAWGLGGWVLALVMGVAWQVVPMLQLTPPYPEQLTPRLGLGMLAALGLLSLSTWLEAHLAAWLNLIAWMAALSVAVAFAIATLRLQSRRRRKLADATLDFWRMGMAALLLCAVIAPVALLDDAPGHEAAQLSLGLAFLLGFAASVVNGMLYKIVPFLAWFHLQAQTGIRPGGMPTMKDFISDRQARVHFRVHLAAVAGLLPAPFLPPFASLPGLLLLAASAALLGLNLLQARRLFLRHGGRL